MEFNEFHHAYLCGSYYDVFQRCCGENAVPAFIKATELYGEQRGHRMALRALRDGNELTYGAYFHYAEWQATPGFACIERTTENGVMLSENFRCPWHTMLGEMGLSECGAVYCRHIDASLVRGFNPALRFEIRSTLHTSTSCRLYFHVGTDRREVSDHEEQLVYPMEYHCAHLFWTFFYVAEAVFGKRTAEEIRREVLRRFAEHYSQAAVEVLLAYADEDFSYPPDDVPAAPHTASGRADDGIG